MSQEATETERLIVYTTHWCGECHRTKFLLHEYGVHFIELDIDKNLEAECTVKKLNNGLRRVPTIVFPDDSILVEPSSAQLAAKLGLELVQW